MLNGLTAVLPCGFTTGPPPVSNDPRSTTRCKVALARSALRFARALGRPVVVVEPGWEVEGLERASSPEEAVERALALV